MCVCVCVCTCVRLCVYMCVCVCLSDKLINDCVDFAKNVPIESYSKKYLSGRLCGDGADQQVDVTDS